MTEQDWLKSGGAIDLLRGQRRASLQALIGRVLSGYRITDFVGEGGMGIVLRGDRAGGDFNRAAAIKLVSPGVTDRDSVHRFMNERRILAGLNHPAIAQLFDAGETDEGWPYLVMEYVDGEPIDEYCRTRGLDLDDGVRLLIQVAEAIRFAHARLIVHRDIKPSNVMVTREGRVKLLDFGIAKLLDVAATEQTQAGRPLTPKYASPEQLLGRDITVASDVYQLGALFLAVLSDSYRDRPVSLEEAIGRAAGEEPEAIPVETRRGLPRDLLAVIERCLRPDPAERYADVSGLLADLHRYLDGYPVSARRVGAFRRLGKLVTRNRPAAAFAGATVISIVVGTVVYTLDLRAATQLAESRADTTGRLLQAMSSMIGDTYSELLESRGQRVDVDAEVLQDEPLRLLLERTDRLIAGALAEEPGLRGELLRLQGSINRQLGRAVEAREQLIEALHLARSAGDGWLEARALQGLLELAGGEADIVAGEQYLAEIPAVIGWASLPAPIRSELLTAAAQFEMERTSFVAAEDYARQAVELLEAMDTPPPLPLAWAYVSLGKVYALRQQPSGIRRWMPKAIEIFVREEGPLYRGLQSPYSSLAWSHAVAGEYELARGFFERELEIALANYGEHHLATAGARGNLGIAVRRMGETDRAISLFSQAIDSARKSVSDDHHILPTLHINLANAYEDSGDLSRAQANFEQALEIAERHADRRPDDLASVLNNLGDLLCRRGEVERGRRLLRRAIETKTNIYGAAHASTGRSMLLLAESLLRDDLVAEAAPLLEQGRRAFEASHGAGHRKMSFPLLVAGQQARATGDLDRARELLKQALALRLDEYAPDHLRLLGVYTELARVEALAGDRAAALAWFERAEPALAGVSRDHVDYVESEVVRAEVLAGGPDPAAAAVAARHAAERIVALYPLRRDWLRRLDRLGPAVRELAGS